MAARWRMLVLASLLLSCTVPTLGRSQPRADERGLTGYVLAPDGAPVSGGNVVLQSTSGSVTAAIARTGRFRLLPDRDGLHQLFVSVPDLAPYRLTMAVPPSRTLKLPVIRLSPPTYFRVRFVSTTGESITATRLRRLSLDASGLPIMESPDQQVADHIDADGTVTLGPLLVGRTMLALDTPPFAQTRLSDLVVTDAGQLLDGGTVIVQPGAVLHVDVVDGEGAPLSAHQVFIEDALPLSPLGFRRAETNPQGRATFDRLGAGRYRLRTSTAARCNNRELSVVRLVSVSGRGTLHTRLVVGGTATFRLMTPLGPLGGAVVSASPNPDLSPAIASPGGPLERAPFVIRLLGPLASQSACSGSTNADGRVSFANFPPGPARIDVRLPNSTYVRLVGVPDDPREMVVNVPEGFMPVRVVSALSNKPMSGAAITWTGGGARVDARSLSDGHALLEGIGPTGGTLEVTASGYRDVNVKLSEAPASLVEIALEPAPALGLQARVITASGEPVANAVVESSVESPSAVGHVAVTDEKGVARLLVDAPVGSLRMTASADGFVTAITRVPEDRRGDIVLTLSRGYRIIANVELPSEAGTHTVRVIDKSGASMEGLLDLASDRSVQPPGRVTLGPLPPGTYIVELEGAGGRHEQRIEILDRDVQATLR